MSLFDASTLNALALENWRHATLLENATIQNGIRNLDEIALQIVAWSYSLAHGIAHQIEVSVDPARSYYNTLQRAAEETASWPSSAPVILINRELML